MDGLIRVEREVYPPAGRLVREMGRINEEWKIRQTKIYTNPNEDTLVPAQDENLNLAGPKSPRIEAEETAGGCVRTDGGSICAGGL